ncbi:hypothetical protein AP75_13000 [Kaistella haifensis DSM 19056]|uniref:Glycosyltransferase 2-like domain-containing protein n=1 Tax=Kaistella haifensis DSM 19056 TaxID=1450526 RepID=A0A246B6S2_9FLAO|nr:glycosyltransferase family 2 protein [Kaistella haifensis]OWK97107.1 hypothetical protein AP75_13000 [Kaistella haifensis DSM 19056]
MVKEDILPEKNKAQPLISVIVPCYNVDPYIAECLESLLAQTYPNFEVIIVDDGSTDATRDCIQPFLKDKRFKLFNQPNAGLSAARNTGLEAVQGEYIAFLDSDDMLHPEFLRLHLKALTENDADISFCGIKRFESCTDISTELSNENSNIKKFNSVQMLSNINSTADSKYIVVCNKIYVSRLFHRHRFAEGKFFEDEYIMHHLMGDTNNIVEISEELYYYRQRHGSIINSDYSDKKFQHAMGAFRDRQAYFRTRKMDSKNLKKRIWHYVWHIWLQKKNHAAKKHLLMHPFSFIQYAPMNKRQAIKNYISVAKYSIKNQASQYLHNGK